MIQCPCFFGYESPHQCNLVPSCSHNYWCSLRRDLDKWWLFFMRTFFSFIANLSVAGSILSHPWQGMLSLCRDLTQSRSSFLLRVRGPPYLGIEGHAAIGCLMLVPTTSSAPDMLCMLRPPPSENKDSSRRYWRPIFSELKRHLDLLYVNVEDWILNVKC